MPEKGDKTPAFYRVGLGNVSGIMENIMTQSLTQMIEKRGGKTFYSLQPPKGPNDTVCMLHNSCDVF